MITDSGVGNDDDASDSGVVQIEDDSTIVSDSQVIQTYDSSIEIYDAGEGLSDQDSEPQIQDSGSEISEDSTTEDVQDIGRDSEVEEDAGIEDSGVEVDTGIEDSSVVDTGIVDTGIEDSGPIDTGVVDTGIVDSGPQECDHPGNWTYVCSNSLTCIPPISWAIIDYESPWCDPYEGNMPGVGADVHILLEGFDENGYRGTLCGGHDATFIQWRNITGPGRCLKVEVEGVRKVYAGIARCDEWERGSSCLVVDERTEFDVLMKKDTQPGWMHITYAEFDNRCPLTCN
jgi:hypothetical protein